ncbi:hypothetical protein [Streptomyces radicis]|uniref:DUF1273 family protein n=1 Tax=Streptomyces radicis TaxID=1750517 RepID=A0A3A9WGI3_9ACTN|nr:hypothetical protein [Streptomyces radicis]RKN12138.1 hypothetical protein D7319_04485 [Streptomyces radicis]RKN25809.1 hypothetical protein D7318_05995 [Streptomyces radicis]
MTTIAVTGHMDLTEESVPVIRAALQGVLAVHSPEELVGVSCIAAGADALFAEAILSAGGRLVVIIPSRDYRGEKVKPEHAETFDRLVEAAVEVHTVPHETANRAAYEAANKELLRRADRLVAVWDGSPPSGKGGGTADVVIEAREAGLPVDVVWPVGAARRTQRS